MRFGIAFLLASVALSASAVGRGAFAPLLVWTALSCLLFGAAYLLGRPGLLGKRGDGTRRAAATAALAPYLCFQHAVWHLSRWMSSEAASHEVAPGIWLGRRPLAREMPGAVRTVVDLTAEFAEDVAVRAGRRYVCVPSLDAMAPPPDQVRIVAEAIATSDGPALIHCAAGHGRSALVAACAMLIRGDARDGDDAVARIGAIRRGARLNRLQRSVLRQVEEDWRRGRGV